MSRIVTVVTIVVLWVASCAWAETVTVALTANTRAQLYPCARCPSQKTAGLGRLASVMEGLRTEHHTILLIDGGNAMGGGALDENSINYSLDRTRTTYFYQALDALRYDAVILGEDEFNFGEDFLKEQAQQRQFDFVASNISMEGISPCSIATVGNYTVGILGLARLHTADIRAVVYDEYISALENIVKHLEGDVDFYILVSWADETTNEEIAAAFDDIALIITPLERAVKEALDSKVAPMPQHGGEIRIITLQIEEGKVTRRLLSRKNISQNIKESKRIRKLYPECFSDTDCKRREGMVAQCNKRGKLSAHCAYVEAKELTVTVITDKRCSFCITSPTEEFLKDVFPGIQFTLLDYHSRQAQKLINTYAIKTLPAFIVPKAIAEEKTFPAVHTVFEEHEDVFFVKKEISGIFLFLERARQAPRIEVFFTLGDKKSHATIRELEAFCRLKKVPLTIHVLPAKAKEGLSQREELLRMLAVKELYPDIFPRYLIERLKEPASSWWPDIMEELGMDEKRIRRLARSDKSVQLLEKELDAARQLNIRGGVVLLVNNVRLFAVLSVAPRDLEAVLEL